MTDRPAPPHRADRRTTALGALAIFVALFAVLVFAAFTRRPGELPLGWALLAAFVAAVGPAMVLALLVANAPRLGTVFHFAWSRVLHALLLGLVTPVAVIHGFPTLAGTTGIAGLVGGIGSGAPLGAVLREMLPFLVMVPVAAAAWYPVVCLLASGIPDHRRRFAAFVQLWWSVYGWLALFGIWLVPIWLVR